MSKKGSKKGKDEDDEADKRGKKGKKGKKDEDEDDEDEADQKGKKGKKAVAGDGDDDVEDGDGAEEQGFDKKVVEEQMKTATDRLRENFNTLRIGRAVPGLLDPVLVEHDGNKVPLKNLAQVSVKDPQTLLVNVFDLEHVKPVMTAIQNANLGFTPQQEKNNAIRVPVPKVTKEFRQAQAKTATKFSEQAKIEVRDVRHDVMKRLSKKKLPEDEKKRTDKEIQKITDKFVADVEAMLKVKTKEILEG